MKAVTSKLKINYHPLDAQTIWQKTFSNESIMDTLFKENKCENSQNITKSYENLNGK